MLKYVVVCAGLLGSTLFLAAQTDSTQVAPDSTVAMAEPEPMMVEANPEFMPEPGPLLNSFELNKKRVFTSIAEAKQYPDSVYRLDLSGQKLKEFPREITRMVNLQELNLSENRIKEIPEDIGNLTNLQVVSFSQNKLRSLPESMQNLLNLERFSIDRNKIMELPVWVGGLGKLRYLDLRLNPMVSYEIRLLESSLSKCRIVY